MMSVSHDRIDESVRTSGFLALTDDEWLSLTADDVAWVRQKYAAPVLIQLPPHEIAFMEWLRQVDNAVWSDLWGDATETPYLVSLAYLDTFSGTGAGEFLICDLQTTDNFFFTPAMILERESADYIAAVKLRFEANQSLTPAQLLALTSSTAPVDIWHFAYKYKLTLEQAKKAVLSLVQDRILVHVPLADHITQYFEIS